MVVLLQGLQGEVTTVDMRNESTARGRLVNVDAYMNVRLEEVLYRDRRGQLTQLQDLFVTGRNVRYVHIPDHVDIMKTIQTQLTKIHRVRNFGERAADRPETSSIKSWFLTGNFVLVKPSSSISNTEELLLQEFSGRRAGDGGELNPQ
ncbi:unnamed protein product [Pleuronectes platessa]|uniref:Sm domain-containing protein n=1 Tax=Pleuronectes platessa TaxID=8262 RepID=A0A9N7Y4X0_PLEPL|nr:unnamed protein product [Pleuronectes platessa]